MTYRKKKKERKNTDNISMPIYIYLRTARINRFSFVDLP